jgi:hypothetical protein
MFQPNLRPQVTELVASTRQLYEETCNLLREKAHTLVSACRRTAQCSALVHTLRPFLWIVSTCHDLLLYLTLHFFEAIGLEICVFM